MEPAKFEICVGCNVGCEVIPMASRAEPRHLIRLRIKVTGTDDCGNRFAQTAFTHDVSVRGARITQVPPFLRPATTIDVEYRGRRSRFRVAWVGGFANDEFGLLSSEPSRHIWGTPLPGQLIRCVSMVSTGGVMQEKRKRVGYFCKDSHCREIRAFHLIADDRVVWDIWPQKIACPVSGHCYEYWKGDIRSAGYV